MSQTIHILGAGAIGKALAVALQYHQKEVVLIRATVPEGSPVTENMKMVIGQGKDVLHGSIRVFPLQHFKRFDGPLVVTSKSYGNKQLAETLQSRVQNTPVILLQNGLGVERPFILNGYTQIYRCVLFITSQISDGLIRLKPVTASPIGIIKGEHDNLNDLVDMLNTETFPFASTRSIDDVVWRKAIANCVFNSICPLLETDNGIFHRDADVLAVAERVVSECLQVANAQGVKLSKEDVMNTILQISKSSDGQLISTLQDIRARRETEIDTLNLEVVRMASDLGMSHNVATTRVLGEMIKLKSAL